MGISHWPFRTLPFRIILSYLHTMDLKTYILRPIMVIFKTYQFMMILGLFETSMIKDPSENQIFSMKERQLPPF